MQAAHRKALDILNSLGLSDSLLRVIDRRQRLDKWITYGGMVSLAGPLHTQHTRAYAIQICPLGIALALIAPCRLNCPLLYRILAAADSSMSSLSLVLNNSKRRRVCIADCCIQSCLQLLTLCLVGFLWWWLKSGR